MVSRILLCVLVLANGKPRYVLSPTHLHEFKSADKAQAPVMSLYLPEQKLGSHSTEGGKSNKFILKGRQTGSMHRGHTWVFRAESHDTMMAWYEDIKALTEKTPQERSEFVRGHSRSISRSSARSISSDGVVDEEDDEPFSAETTVAANASPKQDVLSRRPQPGGRFPSDIQVNAQRGLQAPLSPSSVSSGFLDNASDHDVVAAAGALPGSSAFNSNGYGGVGAKGSRMGYGGTSRTPLEEAPSHAAAVSQAAREDGVNPYTAEPVIPRRHSANYGNNFSQSGSQRRTGNHPASTAVADSGSTRRPLSPQEGGVETQTYGGSLYQAYGGFGSEKAAQPSPYGYEPNGEVSVSGGRGTADVSNLAGAATLENGYLAGSGQSKKATPAEPRAFAAAAAAAADETPLGATRRAQAQLMEVEQKPVRPTAGTVRNDSVPTISNLHIPGEFPKATPTSPSD
jgi:hypothetical protein